MQMFPGESVIAQIQRAKRHLVLTTHRVRYEATSWGFATRRGILLDKLASSGATRTSSPLWLLLAAIAVVGGLLLFNQSRGGDPAPLAVGIAVALLFVIIYAATRRSVIALTCAGGTTVYMTTEGMKSEQVNGFLEQVETAKNDRYTLLT